MDPERAKRRQSIKVIVSESIMVLTVIIMVTVLGFLVSGYWINTNFQIERQGLLQISSIPTGADVSIDGEEGSWFQRTNTSKVLSSGRHTVTLTKEGYDSWSKTINISEGLLYRIHYPRLFLNERKKENVLDASNTDLATMSPEHNYLLLINKTTDWRLINLEDEEIKEKIISVANLFQNADTISSEILEINWDKDSNHILLKIKTNDNLEWILLDIQNQENSINLTKEFSSNFSDIEIIDNSSNNLLAIKNNNLHKINIPSKTLSSVLVENIVNFDHYNNEIIFSAKNQSDTDTPKYYLGTSQTSSDKITKIEDFDNPFVPRISKFYEDKYITILSKNTISLYKKEDFVKLSDFELSFSPEHIKVGHNGEFIIAYSGNRIATLDMESMSITEWSTDGSKFGWLDDDMIYSVSDGDLIVYDYDGFNRRVVANNASSDFPVGITDNKWLYYFSDSELVREYLTK